MRGPAADGEEASLMADYTITTVEQVARGVVALIAINHAVSNVSSVNIWFLVVNISGAL